ncbi:hypothetical protein LX64_04968 [Chitinophaga skermanii]|uniref:Uncharacterized protein n=1 Tax=Chitinophaga skermanii TaxID=331697 RepID=A0A327PZI7_9BACT|nr:hypothetical protein [Chitinophaga skermanii]RAI97665.1 hypothetical protein LX64_04968 [Chitinophaga skermanii]
MRKLLTYLLLFLLLACNTNNSLQINKDHLGPTYVCGKLNLDTLKSTIYDIDSITYDNGDWFSYKFYENEDRQFWVCFETAGENNNIIRLTTNNPKYATTEGVHVGDKLSDIVKKYPYQVHYEAGVAFLTLEQSEVTVQFNNMLKGSTEELEDVLYDGETSTTVLLKLLNENAVVAILGISNYCGGI